MSKTCSDCCFFVSSEGLEMGECHADPPVFNHDLAEILSSKDRCVDCHQMGFWPQISKDSAACSRFWWRGD